MRDERISSIEQVVSVAWPTVLEDWRAGEETVWGSVFKERGYDSWWEWRESYVKDLGLEGREWKETIVENPHEVISDLIIGGYRGWKKYRPEGKDAATYADVARPVMEGEMSYEGAPRADVRTNDRVKTLIEKIHDTTILVLQCGDLSVVMDGAHRCAATAVEALDGNRSNFFIRLRICSFPESDRHLLEDFARDRLAVVKKKND